MGREEAPALVQAGDEPCQEFTVTVQVRDESHQESAIMAQAGRGPREEPKAVVQASDEPCQGSTATIRAGGGPNEQPTTTVLEDVMGMQTRSVVIGLVRNSG